MNLTPLNVVMFGTGVLLIYCAVRDVDPRAVVTEALNGKVATSPKSPPASPPPPSAFGPTPPGAGGGGGGGGSGSWMITPHPVVSV